MSVNSILGSKNIFKSGTKTVHQATTDPATETLTLGGSSSTRSVTVSESSHLLFCITQKPVKQLLLQMHRSTDPCHPTKH